MTVNMKMLAIYFIELVIILPRIITSEEVDPVDFLLSKNSPKNRTISLPKLFKYTGNQTQGDCCTLALFFEVKDLPIPDYGSGMEPPQIDQNEGPTENGQVTFTFLHPQIRNNPYTFTMDVKDVEEKVTTRDQIDFDNCNGINKMTIDIYANTTIMDEKDVRIVMITGKDEGLSCKPKPTPNPPTPKSLQASSVVPALVAGWSIALIFMGISALLLYKNKKLGERNSNANQLQDENHPLVKIEPNKAMDMIQSQKDDSQIERDGLADDSSKNERAEIADDDTREDNEKTGNAKAEIKEKCRGGDVSPTAESSKEIKESCMISGDDVTVGAGSSIESKEISSGGAGSSGSYDVNIAAGSVIKGKSRGGDRSRTREKPRGASKGVETTVLSPSMENMGLSKQIAPFATLIKDNPLLLFTSIAAGLFFVASAIATVICIVLFS